MLSRKSDQVWIWTAINHYAPGILAIQIGDRSGRTFEKLWKRIKSWNTRRYLTDGYCVYANYLEPERHLVIPKTQLTKVEGENTRVQTLFSPVTSSYFMLFKVNSNAEVFSSTLDALFKI